MSTITTQEEYTQVQELLEQFRETEGSMWAIHRRDGSGGVSRVFDPDNIDEVLFQEASLRGTTYRMKLVIDYLDLSSPDLTVLHQVCEEDDEERTAIETMMGSLRDEHGRPPTMVVVGNSFAAGGRSTISNQLVKGALYASHIELRRREQLSRSQAERDQEASAGTQQTQSASTGSGTEASSGDQEASSGSVSNALRSITTRLEELLNGARSIIDSAKQDGNDSAQSSAE